MTPRRRALKSLRDKPFELLRELERLARVALTGQGRDAASEREWVGVAFRMSSENFLVAREETREVLGFPVGRDARAGRQALDSRPRERARPVAAGRGPARVSRRRHDAVPVAARACWWRNHREVPAGLLVDEVSGFRRFADDEFSARRAADDRALRTLSRRRIPARCGELAGVQSAHAARERRISAGGGS